jgi:hydrogenase maturation protein HypF
MRTKTRNALSVGAHLKNTVAVSRNGDAFVSQHIGDMETAESRGAFEDTIESLESLLEVHADHIIADLHPDYHSTGFAVKSGRKLTQVQHHFAHVAACMLENQIDGPVLGVAWDGTGFGPDGTVWGGEFLRPQNGSFERIATFKPFLLPGGEAAIREPRRSALGMLYATFGDRMFDREPVDLLRRFSEAELRVLRRMLAAGISSPSTTSAGRLFDGLAALLGIRDVNRFEGEAAMELEFAVSQTDEAYEFTLNRGNGRGAFPPRYFIDWTDMVKSVLNDVQKGSPRGIIAGRFHNTLSEMVITCAEKSGEQKVLLTGGCFQNRYLTERTVHRLRQEGFSPYWHQRVPPNDGGISLGQLAAFAFGESAQQTGSPSERVRETTEV